MTTVRITIPGVPQQKGSRTHFRNGGSKDVNAKKLEPWLDVAYERIRAAKGDHAGPLFFGPVSVTMIAYYPRRRGDYGTGRNAGVLKPTAPFWKESAPDLDKLQRAVGDALQEAGLIVNDALIVNWDASKVYGDPRVDLIVADAGAIALDVVERYTVPEEQDTLLYMTEPYYADNRITVLHGDCLQVMAELPDASVDAVCTDPPYGLGFMGKAWDSDFAAADMPMRRNAAQDAVNAGAARQGGRQRAGVDYQRRMARDSRAFQAWCQLWAEQCLRVLKPGGHLLAFGGTRTWHRLTCAIEDTGFEIRDSIAWMYGSGFPKSLDVSKAIDRAAGAEREVVGVGQYANRGRRTDNRVYGEATPSDAEVETAPATLEAEQWEGWGTALKPGWEGVVCAQKPLSDKDILDRIGATRPTRPTSPAGGAPQLEPIVVARKPLSGTVAATVLQHGTGALNIDGCRINPGAAVPGGGGGERSARSSGILGAPVPGNLTEAHYAGRWPANVVLDETQAAALDQMSGELTSGRAGADGHVRNKPDDDVGIYGGGRGLWTEAGPAGNLYGDSGGASRFFYTAKAGSGERITHNGISHATVKPLSLMRWLVRLVTPPGGLILEPFAGSGTTVEAALLEGFRCVAIEREADYLPLITQRIHRRRDPIAYLTEGGHDLGLFELDDA